MAPEPITGRRDTCGNAGLRPRSDNFSPSRRNPSFGDNFVAILTVLVG
jgi:hypothetical protein